MSSSLYFAVASALSSSNPLHLFQQKMLDGAFNEARHAVAARVEQLRHAANPDRVDLQAYADVLLVLGSHEEAEDIYRRAQRAIRHERTTARALLSRNAGWQALFQSHLSTALLSFRRVTDDESASAGLKLECLVGATLVLFALGRLKQVCARLDAMRELAAQQDDPRWHGLIAVLREELAIRLRVRAAETLADHIYWHSVLIEFRPEGLSEAPAELAALVETGMAPLARHLAYLRQLETLAKGSHAALSQIENYLRAIQSAGLDGDYRSQHLEVALAALAGKLPQVAESMLHLFRDLPSRSAQHTRWYLDYLYCQAKLRQQQGSEQEYAQLYGRYALLSIKHVRADNLALPGTPAEQPVATDDLSSRLPGKYRRAYCFLIENLERPDLAVHEVATHISVTERALQAAFRTYLGISPSELIRTRRMERIRHELLDDDSCAEGKVLRVANRWGVQHRSTLLNGYRKLYHEAPSDTMSR